MAVAQGPFLAAVLLLVSSRLHCSSPLPACPESCTCQRAPLLNCSSSGLSLAPQHIQDSVTELDLSHNLLDSVTLDRPHRNLKNVWLGNNSIARLSLCIERNLGSHYVRGRHLHRLRPWGKRGCLSWAPTLHLLSAEQNQLEQFPEGLEGSESLQVLQLSFNKISTLQPGDLSHFRQLKELHLQHNLITSLHPQMFQNLDQLRVLDLSFNMLTSLHPLMYLSLRNIGVDVRLGGNRWQCDCSMRSLKRRMAYDSSRGLQAWSVVCASPSSLSGKDLLLLEEDDLNCFSTGNRPELHQDVTVYSGSEILLSCSTQDSMWWTPSGQASVSQPLAGLLINDVTERDTGLYVCVSEEHKVVSVFNLQISKIGGARRKTRSLPRTSRQIIPQGNPNRIGQERYQSATQPDLTLAVCLSVFITFLIAFILGVLARPCIDVLWRRVTNKKSSSATNSVSSVQQRQYDNEAYSNGEEPEEIGTHRERRVTFSTVDFREDSNVQYYDTVASGDQESINNDTVIECEAAEAERDTHTAGDSGSENSLQQTSPDDNQKNDRDLPGITDACRTHNIEFEHIPDPVELEKRRSLSSCSDSSVSDKIFNEDQMTPGDYTTPKSPQLAEDSVQQRADFSTVRKVEVPHISIESRNEIPGYSSEPFADWSPHTNNTTLKDTDLWQESEEQFEFSDSVRSTSARSSSVFGSFNDSKLIVAPTSDKQRRDDMSSSSSYVSGDEPTQYTVNSDQEEEEDIQRNHNKPEVTNAGLKQDASFEQQIHVVDSIRPSVGFNQGDYRYDTQRPAVRPYSSSSSSESEAEITDLKVEHNTGRVNEMIKVNDPETLSTDLSHQCIPQIRRRFDINDPLPPSDSSSSDESTDETKKHTKKQEQGDVDMARLQMKKYQSVSHDAMKPQLPALYLGPVTPIKRRLDIRAPSPPTDSYSSGESADETMDHMQRQKQGETHMTWLQFQESQTISYDPQTQKLEHTTHIKRRLDIKAPSPDSDSSSSSDCEDETTGHTEKQRPEMVGIVGLPFKRSTESHDPDTRCPGLDLEHIPRIKKCLDIKAPSPPPDSSSSSDSEDETTNHIKEQEQGQMHMARPPIKVSKTVSHDPKTQWPALDLEHTTRIKRRLDIKTSSLACDSSSSSDSEDETTHHTERPGKVDIAGLPFQESQTVSHDPDTRWPALDLEHIPRIKKRLDIKAPSPPPDSSSGSDSEDETSGHREKQRPDKVDIAGLPFQESQAGSHDPETQWPALDLEHTMHIKRRLDIKAPSPPPDSSSSSDSDDETTNHIKKQGKGETHTARLPIKVSQTVNHDPKTQWPALDLEHTTHIKRRLDIKAPSPESDSSSSSEIVEEKIAQIQKHEQGEVHVPRLPFQESQAGSHDPETQWPALDLEHTMRIKRRLDIKAPSPPPDSYSSSDSEKGITNHIKKQGKGETHIAKLPIKVSQTVNQDPKTQWPGLDLEHTTRIKRRLDIKAPSLGSDSSSSSDSEDESSGHKEKQRPSEVEIAGFPFQEFQTVSHDPDTRWPALDLEHIMRIKRRLDIKAPSPSPDSSSSSDNEAETTNPIKKQEQGQMHMARLPIKVSKTVSHDQKTQWPALDLEHTTRIKRRLDIKTPSLACDSSSNSDSEDETTHHTERPGKVDIAGHPFQESQTVSHDPDTRWPALDLEHIPRIKRRLNIKAPSPPPDSFSNSEIVEEKIAQIQKHEQGEVHVPRLPFQESQAGSHDPETQWPALDLEHTMRIKRRLDIKAPSPPPDSYSSSNSEKGITNHIKKQGKGETHIAKLPIKVSQTVNQDPKTQWPGLDLEHTTRIKRRLDIKAPSLGSDSSSSSDSEDESSGHKEKQRPGKVDIAELPFQKSHTESHDPDTRWPALDLEHIPRIKRRLDIKAPSPPPDSSFNSEIVEEKIVQIKKHQQGGAHISRLPFQESQVESHDPETRWPTLDLEHTTRIKRCLDIKAQSPASDSSSSSDSEDETIHHTKKERPGVVGIAGLMFQESQTVSHEPATRWPAIDLGNITRIKRHLDLKAPSPAPGSLLSGGSTNYTEEGKREEAIKMSPCYSSSSSDEQEGGMEDLSNLPTTVELDPDSRWPKLDLSSAPHVKRRLDIKPRSLPPSEGGTTDLPLNVERNRTDAGITSHQPGTELADLNMSASPIKRRLNIKAPSQPADSCSFNSDNESRLSSHTVKHRRDKGDTGITNHEQQTKLHKLSLGVPYINRRLDIKAPSPQPDPVLSSVSPGSRQSESNSFRSDSEDENRDHTKLGLGISVISKDMEKVQSPKTPVINISRSPKTDHNIKLEKYTVITDDTGDKTTSDNISTPEINPELESRWATMNLGISRFRKRLEITSHIHDPPNLPSSPPPEQNHTSLYVAQAVNTKLDQPQSQTEEVKPKHQTKVGEESDSMRPHLSPHIKRALDIRAPLQREASSSSNSENETIDHSVLDLSPGVPRVKRCLNVKTPLPEPSNSSSSCSESENEVTNMSGMTDNDTLITYKRLIMKTLPPPSNSSSPSGQTIDHTNQRHTGAETVTVAQEGPSHSVGDKNAYLAPRRVPSTSFDDVVKKRIEQSKCTTDVDLPPEIRWTGVGHQLYDLSISSPRRHLDVGLLSPPAEPELPPPDSFNSSSGKSDKIKQDRGKADVTLMQYSSLSASSVSLASSRSLDKFDNLPIITNELLRDVSEDNMERKGLRALKVMSSERQKWDTEDGNLDKGASPVFDDHGSQGDTSFNCHRSEKDIKPLAKQPLTQIHLSSSIDEKKATDLLYGIPRYRRHDIGDIKPLQKTPPPIPATPPVDEVVGLTWRSPQSSKKQGLEGTRAYLQQSRNAEETDPSSLTSQNLAVYFDSLNMNISDV